MTDKKAEKETVDNKPMNIHQRISAIQAGVTTVGKDADVDGKYTAVTHDAVTKMLSPLMVKHGVVSKLDLTKLEVIDTGMKWGKRNLDQLRAEYVVTYFNIDNPEDKLAVTVAAFADEAGDKGPGKIASYAQKYADLKTFRIPTGEDDEQRVDDTKLTEPTLSEEHLQALAAKAEELFMDDSDDKLASLAEKIFQVGGYHNILDKHFDVAMRKLDEQARRENPSD